MDINEGTKRAIVISVSDYDILQPLEFCKNDGDERYGVLESLNYEIQVHHKLVGRVRLVEMRSAIVDFFRNTNVKPSYYESDILKFSKKKSILPLERLLSRYAWVGAFTAALIPIPDLVSVPLGMTKYSAWKFAIAIFSGKFIFNEVMVWGSIILRRAFIKRLGLLGPGTTNITSKNSVYLVIGIASGVAILAIIIYVSLRIDWAKIIGTWFPWTLGEGEDIK